MEEGLRTYLVQDTTSSEVLLIPQVLLTENRPCLLYTSINDKHIEVIVHQMLKKIRIEDNGDSEFLPGTLVDFLEYEDVNEKLEAEGLRPAIGKQGMLGITKRCV